MTKRGSVRISALALTAILLIPRLSFEGERAQPFSFHANAQLVLVPLVVTDQHGKTVTGLEAQNFKIFDDQAPQRIVSFARADAPCSVALVLDLSGSMRETLQTATDVVHSFRGTVIPEDEFLLLTVSTEPHQVLPFTSNIRELEGRIDSGKPQGLTALIDTVYLGLSRMRKANRSRRAMLILSDGMDNHSRYTESELRRRAREADVQIYTILVSRNAATASGAAPMRPLLGDKPWNQAKDREGPSMLEALSKETGGVFFRVSNQAEAKDAAIKAGEAIRNEYVIGYQPLSSDSKGKWHRVRVQADLPHVKIYARQGYYDR